MYKRQTVGIATTQPAQRFQVGVGTQTLVVTGVGTLGVGTANPGDFGINNTIHGELKADFDGSVRIARNIYDSSGSPGQNGFFMNRDANGIRWVSFTPVETEGVFLQNDGVYVPSVGAAQSFTVLNFTQRNSFGTGTDTIEATAQDPNTITGFSTIFTQDFWGYQGSGGGGAAIYRMSRVGINESNPSTQLDVNGTMHVSDNVDFDSQLNVDGGVTFNSTFDVDGAATFNNATDATSTTTGSVQIDGGVGIVKKLFVGDDTKIEGTTESTSKDSGALIVEGGVGIEKNLNIGGSGVIAGRLDVDNADESTSTTTGAAVIDGGLGLAKNLNVGGAGVIAGRLDIDDTTQSTSITSGALVVDGGVGIAQNLNVGQQAKIEGNLELDASLIDVNQSNGVGVCKTDYRLASVGTGVSWRPSGVQTKRTLWVTKNGCDTNSGLLEGDAKFTIASAAAVAQEGDTIKVRSGVYIENNPVGLRTDVAISGEDLRLVTVVPSNANRDVFHVRRGCLIENLSFAGASIATNHPNCGGVAFPPTQASVNAGTDFQAVSGFTALGPANEGAGVGGAPGRWRSPYVRNCTNFMTGSIGMKINGDHANAAFSGDNNLGQDLKSMVCDSYTQYNEAGIGVSITNNGYAQLVSIFTIGCDVGISVASGGQCDLTNSNSSFGNFGLKADGFGDIEFTGSTNTETDAQVDTIVSINTKDSSNAIREPFDGQGVYFHLNMSNYDDSPSNATITAPLQLIREIKVISGGNIGDYEPTSPPVITLNEEPQGPEAILPEFSPNVSIAGTITSVDVINSGRNFLPTQNLSTIISSGNATFQVITDPILFTVSEATETADVTGITTVTFNEFIPFEITSGVPIKFVRLSRIITSSHSFEYIGAGTDINTSNPFQGGKPVPDNEVIAINGGQVPFTSTDQKGNFRIGDGLTIDQTTSTIRGRDFNRAIQAQLTPLILALR